jgi:chemotaxis protein MotB
MARQRRKVFVDANNHDRWIVSYADFITLLFAFFVVMYSISSVNEGKYRSLTASLGSAFSNKDTQEKVVNPVVQSDTSMSHAQFIPLEMTFESQIGAQQAEVTDKQQWELTSCPPIAMKLTEEQPTPLPINTRPALLDALTVPFEAAKINEPQEKTGADNDSETQAGPLADINKSALSDTLNVPFEAATKEVPPEPEVDKKRELSEEILKERKKLGQVSDQLENALSSFIKDDLVSVTRNDYWIELQMNSELLFLSGEAALSRKAQPVLKEIAQVINTLPNAVNVEGHTDNIPINNIKFPSNWDLSSARATSVVQELIRAGVDPTRLSALGYGEFHPLGDNSTGEGRFKNRRVTLVLMSQAFSRYGANDEERAKLLNLQPSMQNTPASQP